MTGLNDQFFLADDSVEPKDAPAVTIDAFKDTTEPGDVPELRDDLDLIAVATEEFEIKLRDLSLLQEMIRDEGGMSKRIALEAHAIMPEFLNDDRPIEFFTKTPSRTQLSVALEEIGNEKKSLIKRMIESIVAFIKKLVKRITDFFIVDETQAKADAEFAKNYKGPTDEAVASSVKDFAKQNAKDTPEAKQAKTQAPAEEASLEEVLQFAEKVTGERIDANKAREIYLGKKMPLILAMLGKDRLAVVAALMNSDFFHNYQKVLTVCERITDRNWMGHEEKNIEDANELESLVNQCNAGLAEAAHLSEQEQRSMLAKWVKAQDTQAISRMHTLFGNLDTGIAVTGIKVYLNELQQDIEKLSNSPDPDALGHLKAAQRLVSVISATITLIAKADNAYSTVIKGLRK